MKLTPTQRIFIQLCQQSGLPTPQPEFVFHPERKWRIDYFFSANGKKVGLEIEGGAVGKQVICDRCGNKVRNKNGKPVLQAGGRHTHTSGYISDLDKYNNISMHGIILLRIQPKDLLKTSTTKMILNCLQI